MPIVKSPVSKVHLPAILPREIDRDHVLALAEKLRTGVILPAPLAVEAAGGYEIVVGAHRFLAHVEAKRETIELSIPDRPLSPGEIKLEQWRENEDRLGFSLPDRATLMVDLMNEFEWTQDELAEHLKVSPAQVSKTLQVSRYLAVDLQAKILTGELCPRSAYILSNLRDDHEAQRELYAMKLTKCSALEREVRKRLDKRVRKAPPIRVAARSGLTIEFPGHMTREQAVEELQKLLRRVRKEEGEDPIRFAA